MTLFRRTDDERLAEEIETHLSLLEDEYRKSGMDAKQARDAARRALGGELKTRHLYREASRWRWLETFLQDARFGLRLLWRDKAFAITAALVLGIGIGVNNMQFTIIYTHTLRALPIADAERVLIGSFVDERGVDRGVAYDEYEAAATGSTLLEELAAFGGVSSVALGDQGRAPDRYLGVYTTGNAFEVLRVRPIAGRPFTDQEQAPGSRRVAMLGGHAWQARYDADPSVVGREVLVDGKPTVIVGILAAESGFPSGAEVFLPFSQSPRFAADANQRTLRAIGRVREGASVEQAQAQLSALLEQATQRDGTNLGLRPSVGPITTRFRGRASDPAWIAFFAVGFLVVGVASANAANLMLARASRRGRELAIRGSLGASRRRIICQLLVESVVLAAAGAVVGVLVSVAGVRLFSAGVPPNAMPYWFRYSMDPTILVALVAVSLATVIIFGLLPALHASRTDVSRVLKDGGWGGTGRRSARWQTTAFMVAQVAFSVVLMSYVVHDLTNVDDTTTPSDVIVDTPDVVTAALNLPADRYGDAARRATLFTQLQERTRALPGIESASLTTSLPRNGASEQRLHRDGVLDFTRLPSVATILTAPGLFETLAVPLRKGRDFTDGDAGAVAIVNDRFVELFLKDADPIGHRLALRATADDKQPMDTTIVGVAQDIRYSGGAPAPAVYLPLASAPPAAVSIVLRSTLDAAAVTRQLRDAVLGLDPHLPVHQVMTLDHVIRDASWNTRMSARLITVLSCIVLLLSTVGLYAVTVHAVNQRAKELGIRIAIGARPAELRWLVLSRAAVQVALGLVFGIVCTYAWDRVFADAVSARQFTSARVLGPIAGVLAAAMITACLAPVRKAVRLDPVAILRQD